MKITGTLVLTDPCYVVREDSDDWERCAYGDNMGVLGLHSFIAKPTLVGDCNCAAYKVFDNPYKVVDTIARSVEDGMDFIVPSCYLGSFGVDSGLMGIFSLYELKAYNPKIEEWIASHPWCATVIPDFDGEVNYYEYGGDRANLSGEGNFNFITE